MIKKCTEKDHERLKTVRNQLQMYHRDEYPMGKEGKKLLKEYHQLTKKCNTP